MLDLTANSAARLPRAAMTRTPISEISSAHLDAIRGLAALAVFLGHWRSFWWPHYSQGATSLLAKLGYFITGFPHQAVIVFFVLSGYLVGGSVLRSIDKWQWRPFLIARLARLWVVLIPALGVGYFLDSWGIILFNTPFYIGDSVPIYWNVSERLGIQNLICNIFFIQTIACQPLGTNGVLWSLANEFWYYVIFPLLTLAMYGNFPKKLRAAYFGLALVIMVFVGWKIIFLFPIWLMGAAITMAPQALFTKRILAVTQFSAFLLLVCFAILSRKFEGILTDFPLGLAFSFFVWTILQSSGSAQRNYKVISEFLSAISYSLYLCHLPALVFISSFLMGTHLNNTEKSLVSLVTVFIYSLIFYSIFERQTPHFRRLISSLLPGK